MISSPDLLDDVDRLYDLDPQVIQDPYPVLHRMREEAPVLIHRDVASVTRYRDVEAAFRDSANFSSRRAGGSREQAVGRRDASQAAMMDEILAFISTWIISQDAPDHIRHRGLVHRAFTPRVLAEMREQVQKITDDLFDSLTGRDVVDFVNSFAYELPVRVIGNMLGAPPAAHDRIVEWSRIGTRFFGSEYANVEEAFWMFRDFRAFVRELIEEHRETHRTNLLAALLAVEHEGVKLTPVEIEGNFLLLLRAGHETTTNLISNGLRTLLAHPEEMALLKGDPSLVPNAVEELVRYESPVQAIHRRAVRATELGGVMIPEGMTVRLWVAAANRDPAEFNDPDRVDIRRDIPRHLGFGIGSHYCLGQALARMEGQTVFDTLVRRFPNVEGAGPFVMRQNFLLRRPDTLPVRLGIPA